MKLMGWLLVSSIGIGAGALALRGGCLTSEAPDEKLAGHLENLCGIARDNVDSPERGVRQLGGYFGKHTGDMLGEFGSTMQVIETISDDAKHDERALVARERIQRPLRECTGDWQRFFEAVEADPEAAALLDRGMNRINRTFEIIFGKQVELRSLPALLSQRFEPAT